MLKAIRPTEHLTDLEVRIRTVIFSMTPAKSREDLRAEVFRKRFGEIKDDRDADHASDVLDADFKALSNDQDFSKMVRNHAAYLTNEQVTWICDALGVDEEDFLDIDIRRLIHGLAEAAEIFQWNEAKPEAVFARVAELYLLDPTLDPRPGSVPTLFADYHPRLFEQTNHSNTKSELYGLLSAHRLTLLGEARQFLPFSGITNPRLSIRRLRVAASSDVYQLKGPGGPYLLKVIRRLEKTALQSVQDYECFFADAQLFEDAECLRPLAIGPTGQNYVVLKALKARALGLAERDHLITLQRYAKNRVMFGQHTIPKTDFVEGSADRYLISLARSLARLHVATRDLNSATQGCIDVKGMGFHKENMLPLVTAFDTIFGSSHEFTRVWLDPENHRLIHKAAEEYDTWHAARPRKRPYVMYDLHPFNAFFDVNTKTCTLIFDFEGMTNEWLEEDVLAFTTHRFVREYVRAKNLPGDRGSADDIRRAVELMANAYVDEGGELADDYLNKVGSLIRITNFGKFITILRQLIRGEDFMDRNIAVHDAEARKFLLYLRESNMFENA